MREGKLTLPALYVLNMFDDEEMRKLALRIRALDASDEDIARFIEYTKVKGGIEYARQAMVDYRNKALALLPQSAGQAVKDALTAYIDYVIERDNSTIVEDMYFKKFGRSPLYNKDHARTF